MPDLDSIQTRQDFARELTRLRDRAGLSVRDVVAAIPRQARRHGTVSDWFAGRGLPQPASRALLEQVVRACGATDDEVSRWVGAWQRVRRTRATRAGEEPYRGLNRFEARHAGWFFGREELTGRLVERVRGLRAAGGGILLVTGASGVGKSSLLRAGLVAALGAPVDGSPPVESVVLTPGPRPLDAWAARPGGRDLGADPVVVVDQFEEIFAPGVEPQHAREFVRELSAAAAAGRPGQGPVVVLGLRADFYADLLRFPSLASAAQDHQLTVGPMSAAELRRAIVEPARKAGVDIEAGLVELLLREVAPRGGDLGHDPGVLPLLSHALLATWEAGGGRLTAQRYRASGGIGGAVAATADAVHAALGPDHRALARALFLRLVHVGEGIADTRRRMSRAELRMATGADPADLDEVVDRFVERRLLTVDDDAVEISHEALLTAWPQLRDWLHTDRAGLLVGQQVTDAAADWDTDGGDSALLLRGARLAVAQQWLAGQPTPPELAARFVRASTRYARRRVRLLYQIVAALTVLAVVSSVAGVVAVRRTGEAVALHGQVARQRDEARSRLVAARADQLRDKDVSLSRQLALTAYRIAPTVEARSSLIGSSAALPAIRMLTGKNQIMYAVAISPDGRLLAAAVDDTVRIWDIAVDPSNPVPVGEPLTGPAAAGYSIAFSPDGRLLALGSGDHRVHLWHLTPTAAEPVPLPPLAGATNTVYSVAFSPDGRLLAAASADGVTRRYDTSDRTRPAPVGPDLATAGGAKSVAFHPSGRILCVGGVDGSIRLWDLARPGRPRPLSQPAGPAKEIGQVVFSPDGRTLAAGGTDFTTRLWDTSDPARPVSLGPPLTGPKSFVNAVAFSPDGTRLAVGSSDPAIGVQVHHLATRRVIATLPHPAPVTAVRFSPDGTTVATGSNDGTARIWPLTAPVLSAPGVVSATVFSPDGRTLAVGSTSTQLWDVGRPDRPVPVGQPLTNPDGFSGALAFDPDGRTLAISARLGTVQLWDLSDPTRPARYGGPLRAHDQLVETLAISPDGRILATGSRDHTIRIWDITHPTTPVPVGTLRGFTNYVQSLAFSPDGSLLAAGGIDRSVRLWDIADPRAPTPLGPPLVGDHYVYSVVFSPDRRTLAVGSADSSIRLYDVSEPDRPVPVGAPLTGPTNYVYALSFNRDGTELGAAVTNAGVWLWDLADRARPAVRAVLPTSGATYSIGFHPDGETLGAGGTESVVWLWSTRPERAAARICATVGDRITEAEWARYVPGPPYQPPCPVRPGQ